MNELDATEGFSLFSRGINVLLKMLDSPKETIVKGGRHKSIRNSCHSKMKIDVVPLK